MSLKLVKTIGGDNGSPLECGKCGSKHFSKSGIAWHCITCGNYHPTTLGYNSLKEGLLHAESLMKKFKRSIDDLEDLVKKS